jgi:hypothetical protein
MDPTLQEERVSGGTTTILGLAHVLCLWLGVLFALQRKQGI